MIYVLVVLVLCGLGAAGTAGYALGIWRARKAARIDVEKLEGGIEELAASLQSARTSERIVQAIRDGSLGVEELRESGFDEVRAIAPPAALVMTSERYQPFRRQARLPAKITGRIKVTFLPVGTEIWISMTEVRADHKGRAWVPELVWGGGLPTIHNPARLRCLEDGSFELAFDPDCPTTAGPLGDDNDVLVEHVTLLRKQDRVRGRPVLARPKHASMVNHLLARMRSSLDKAE